MLFAISWAAGAVAETDSGDREQSLAAGDVVDAALAHARVQRFDEALATLDGAEPGVSNSLALRYARARILAWAGQYDQAEAAYGMLLQDYPEDPDIRLGHAYLAYYQGEYAPAEVRFTAVLADFPSYDEARSGLERVRRARESADESAPAQRRSWRLDAGAEISTFSRSANDDWTYTFAQVSHIGATRGFNLRAERYDRFGLNDETFGTGFSSSIGANWDGAVSLKGTPDADFRPEFGADVELGRAITVNGAQTFRPFVRYSVDIYDAQTIHGVSPGFQTYWRRGVSIDARLITVLQAGESAQFGGQVRISAQVSDDWRITTGAANAPEAINGEVVRTRSVFGGVEHEITEALSLRFDYARDDRESSFIRNAFSVSIAHKL